MTNPSTSYRTITLSKGQVAIVDEEDHERLSKHKWSAAWDEHTQSFYAVRSEKWPDGTTHPVKMAREIMGLKFGDKNQVDHRFHDTLDNRKIVNGEKNLRIASGQQNSRNQRTPRNNTTGVRGVSYNTRRDAYEVRIMVDGRRLHLGYRKTLAAAAELRAAGTATHHKDFAWVSEQKVATT